MRKGCKKGLVLGGVVLVFLINSVLAYQACDLELHPEEPCGPYDDTGLVDIWNLFNSVKIQGSCQCCPGLAQCWGWK